MTIYSIVLDPSKSKAIAQYVEDQMNFEWEEPEENPIFETNNFSRGLFDEPSEFYLSDKQIHKRLMSELPRYDTIYDNTPPQKVINYGPSLNKLFRSAKKQKIEA